MDTEKAIATLSSAAVMTKDKVLLKKLLDFHEAQRVTLQQALKE